MKRKLIYTLVLLLPLALMAQPEPGGPNLFQQGLQQYNNQQYDAAIQSFTKFVNLKPNPGPKPPQQQQAVPKPAKKGEAYYYIGMSFLKKGNNDQALSNFTKALELKPDPQTKLARGKVYMEQKKYDLAIPDLTAAAQAMSGNEEAHYQLGMAFMWQGNYAQAIPDFKRVLEINNRHHYAHYHIGLAYSKINENGLAEQHWRIFIELCPTCPETPGVNSFINRR